MQGFDLKSLLQSGLSMLQCHCGVRMGTKSFPFFLFIGIKGFKYISGHDIILC